MSQLPYEITTLARADLKQIWFYIARDNPSAADQVIEELYETFYLIGTNPQMGERCDELGQSLRRLSVGSYVVYFREEGSLVLIVRVLHGALDVTKLF